jgi:hypothetical protein
MLKPIYFALLAGGFAALVTGNAEAQATSSRQLAGEQRNQMRSQQQLYDRATFIRRSGDSYQHKVNKKRDVPGNNGAKRDIHLPQNPDLNK